MFNVVVVNAETRDKANIGRKSGTKLLKYILNVSVSVLSKDSSVGGFPFDNK